VPELPDVTVYVEHLERRLVGEALLGARIAAVNLLGTVEPPVEAAIGATVTGVRRIGKRIAIGFASTPARHAPARATAPVPGPNDLHLVFHLMIAGRFRWRARGAAPPGRIGLAAFEFTSGTLILTEAGTKRRATLHVVRGEAGLQAFDAGGIDPIASDAAAFRAALGRERHTLKRALTDPRLFDGIGGAYSDEILHRARLSPLRLTDRLEDDEVDRLRTATRDVLVEWTGRLRAESGDRFPEKVTAFREGMAVHGRYRQPCPVCGTPIQRIVYAEHETNYCPRCQTEGRVLADRALSRLLRDDWPRTIEALEQARRRREE
jgi:formamidopyrimidine-DNA glycosylase